MELEFLTSFFSGVFFGLALAAPPGPMNAVIAEHSAIGGFRAGVTAGLGAMLADLTFLVLSLLGVVTIIQEVNNLQAGMIAVGGVMMLYFAVDTARNLGQSFITTDRDESTSGVDGQSSGGSTSGFDEPDIANANMRGFRRALALALTNPYQIIFWLTVGVGLLTPGTVDILSHTPYVGDRLTGIVIVTTGKSSLILGLFGGLAVWTVGFPATVARAGKRIDKFGPIVAGLSAFLLAGFGIFFLLDSLSSFGVI